MAIDIELKDGIDSSLETKLRGMANAAAALNRNLSKINKTMGGLSVGGAASGGIAAMTSVMPTRVNAAASAMPKRVETAFVTKQKELEKQRKEITAAFETGFRAREKQAADIVKMIERQKRDVDFNSVLGVTKPTSAAALKRQQADYDKLFGAHNITTVPKKQDTRAVIDEMTGGNIKKSSVAALREQQKAYDELFNAIQPAKINSITSSMSRATQAQNNWTTSANNTSSAMQRLDKSVSFLRSDGLRWAKVLWALGGATLTAGAIVQAADAYTRLQNRLSVVADSQGQVNQLSGEMLKIANSSRQPIEETTKTFVRFDLAMQQIGRSQKDSMQLTANVAKALKLGGATAGEAASALLQLSQAFNKGKLDGDEFRSMMENSPILADALAKQLNVTRGALLKLAPEGKITAKVMADAWLKATDDINKAFEKLKPTIAESFTVLRNSATMFFGQIDDQLGLTAALSSAIMGLSNHLDTLLFVFLALTPIIATFIGAQTISALATFSGFVARTAISVGALRSPITVAAIALFNLGRNATGAGISMVTAFTSANTRAIALQLTLVRLTAGVLALGNVAKRAGAALLGMFSFGNILMVLAVATAAAYAFGDQLIINAEKGYTMRDAVVAAFQVMWTYIKEVGEFITDLFFSVFDGINVNSKTTGEKMLIMFGAISSGAATAFDAVATEALAAFKAVQSIYYMAKALYELTTAFSVFNGGSASSNVADAMLAAADSYEAAAAGAGAKVTFANNLLENVVSDFKTQMAKNAAAQAALAKVGPPKTRIDQTAGMGGGKGDKDGKGKNKKTPEEKRADILEKVINKEKSAAEVAKRLGDERERLSVIEDLNNKLKEKNLQILTQEERASIETLVQKRITAERVGEAMNDYYDRLNEAPRAVKVANRAIKELLAGGVITKPMADSFAAEAIEKYKEASDNTYEYAKALEKVRALTSYLGDAYEIEQAVYDAREKARGSAYPFTEEDADRIRKLKAETLQYERVQGSLQELHNKVAGAFLQSQADLAALNATYQAGSISVGMYTRSLAALQAEQGRLNELKVGITAEDPLEPIRRGFYQFVADMPQLGQAMADAIDSTLNNALNNVSSTLTDMITNFDAYGESVADALGRPVSTLEVMRYALADIIQQIGKDLINALIKMGIQMAIQSALGKSMEAANAAATIATQSTTAAAVNAAWTPPAISASIATQGAASITGLSGFMTAQLTGRALSAIPALQDGGVLGGMGTGRSDSTLFWGSRGEMIMNKGAVERNGPMLHAANAGQTIGGNYIDNSIHVSVVYQDGQRQSQSGNGDAFTDDLVRFIDSRVSRGVRGITNQGKQGYGG